MGGNHAPAAPAPVCGPPGSAIRRTPRLGCWLQIARAPAIGRDSLIRPGATCRPAAGDGAGGCGMLPGRDDGPRSIGDRDVRRLRQMKCPPLQSYTNQSYTVIQIKVQTPALPRRSRRRRFLAVCRPGPPSLPLLVGWRRIMATRQGAGRIVLVLEPNHFRATEFKGGWQKVSGSIVLIMCNSASRVSVISSAMAGIGATYLSIFAWRQMSSYFFF